MFESQQSQMQAIWLSSPGDPRTRLLQAQQASRTHWAESHAAMMFSPSRVLGFFARQLAVLARKGSALRGQTLAKKGETCPQRGSLPACC